MMRSSAFRRPAPASDQRERGLSTPVSASSSRPILRALVRIRDLLGLDLENRHLVDQFADRYGYLDPSRHRLRHLRRRLMNTPPMASNAFAVDPREKRIAVLVDREGLGDALLKIPFLRAIRRAFPAHRIWWIATHQTAMEDDLAPWVAPLIDRVISHAGLTSPDREIIPRLRAAAAVRPGVRCAHAFHDRAAGAPLSQAPRLLRLPAGLLLSDRLPPGRWTRPKGVAARMLTMIEAATGRAADWKGTFEVSPAAQRLAAQRLPDGPRYVGLAPGSREVRKNWPLDRFMALATALAAKGYAPAFLIGPQERGWLATLRAGVPQALFPEAEPVDPALGIGRLEFAIALGRRLRSGSPTTAASAI